MGFTTTVQQVIDDVRDRTDQTNDRTMTDERLIRYINSSVAAARDVIHRNSDEWFMTQVSGTLASGDIIPSPSDLYKPLMVEFNDSSDPTASTGWRRLREFPLEQLDTYDGLADHYDDPKWHLYPQQGFKLIPLPVLNRAYRISYIPLSPVLTGSAETFESFNGFHELVVVDVCRKVSMKMKLWEQASEFEKERERIERRIEEQVQTRNISVDGVGSADVYGSRGTWRNWWWW